MSPSPSISEANNNSSMQSFQQPVVEFDEIKTLTTQNGGKKRPRIFSDAEFERRVSNLRQHMEDEVMIYCYYLYMTIKFFLCDSNVYFNNLAIYIWATIRMVFPQDVGSF